MRYLDKDWFIKSQKYPPDDSINDAPKALRDAENKDGIPEKLRRDLCFHDGRVISEEIVKSGAEPVFSGDDYVLRISGLSGHGTVIFRDAIVKAEQSPAGAEWLYEEIYRHKSGKGYEIHILLSRCRNNKLSASDLIDMKIICRDIAFR